MDTSILWKIRHCPELILSWFYQAHDSSTILPWENVAKEIIILFHAGSHIAQA